MQNEPLCQLAVCDLCQTKVARQCYVRLRLQLCEKCVVLVEFATGEELTALTL